MSKINHGEDATRVFKLVHPHSEVDELQSELLQTFNDLKTRKENSNHADNKWGKGGEAFKSIRKIMGLNQQSFAEMLKVSKTTLSGWERGTYRPHFQTLVSIMYQLVNLGKAIGKPEIANYLRIEDFGYDKRGKTVTD